MDLQEQILQINPEYSFMRDLVIAQNKARAMKSKFLGVATALVAPEVKHEFDRLNTSNNFTVDCNISVSNIIKMNYNRWDIPQDNLRISYGNHGFSDYLDVFESVFISRFQGIALTEKLLNPLYGSDIDNYKFCTVQYFDNYISKPYYPKGLYTEKNRMSWYEDQSIMNNTVDPNGLSILDVLISMRKQPKGITVDQSIIDEIKLYDPKYNLKDVLDDEEQRLSWKKFSFYPNMIEEYQSILDKYGKSFEIKNNNGKANLKVDPIQRPIETGLSYKSLYFIHHLMDDINYNCY